MKNLIVLIRFFIAIILLQSCADDSDEPVLLSQLEVREFTSISLMNNHMNNSEIRKMQVYTPKGYDQNNSNRYPVVYLLHGLPFSEESFVSKSTWDDWVGGTSPFQSYPDFPEEGFKNWIDGLIESGKIDPMIIVMPNAANNNYGFSFYTNSLLNGGFEDYIVNDLVKYMDSHYRTIANKDGRAVIGFSQGGYAAVKFGMTHSEIFGVVAGHSGLLYLDGMLSLGAMISAENPDGNVVPDPNKFFTSAMFAMSSAWSPNINNPPFMVDLPFLFPSGDVIPEVRNRWLEHCTFAIMDRYQAQIKSLNGIYVDCGTMDELGMTPIVEAFVAKMNAFGIDHTYETFEGGHFNKMFSRLETSLAFCSERMN